MRTYKQFYLYGLCIVGLWSLGVAKAQTPPPPIPSTRVIANTVEGGGGFVSFVNSEVGAGVFYDFEFWGQSSIIANVEAGHVWGGHEVFNRSTLPEFPSSPAVFLNAVPDPLTTPQLGEFDFHATMVGHVLAGTGLNNEGQLTLVGIGMAPLATLWSGAIATSFDPVDIGSFSITRESFTTPYVGFFRGIAEGKADVINSSWGFDGAGGSPETRILDAMAAENPTVASVVAAGNAGPAAGTVGEPASGHNSISVGALRAATFDGENTGAAEFSSRGPSAFYNPLTDEHIANARAAVHVSAPGENMALAAYLGNTGGLTGLSITEATPSTDLYFVYNMSGTSFAAPVVAGGIALLKDVAKQTGLIADLDAGLDSRVIRSVLMASARATPGWDNQQLLFENVLTTTQALDYTTGAGALDLTRALEVYAFHTAGLPVPGGGDVSTTAGWDRATVGIQMTNDYVFDSVLAPQTELTLSLNWFVHERYDETNMDLHADSARFANLNLEVWRVENAVFTEPVARSASLYNNTEFLRLLLPDGGTYGFRVAFDDWTYTATPEINSEIYAVAWSAVVIPEPASLILALLLVTAALGMKKRTRDQIHCNANKIPIR